MNPLSLMDCNAKSAFPWEWENLISFSAAGTDVPRKLRTTDWEMDEGGGMNSESLYSPGFGGGSGGSVSDLGYDALSKSSKSTSISSSSTGVKMFNFTSETCEGSPEEFSICKEFTKGTAGTSPTLEVSFGSGDPLLGLRLGKRTYFEDICAGNSAKGSTFCVNLTSSVTPVKRSKSNCLSMQAPRCQVEGCNLDLSSAKDYHRKHRVCESHSKCPKVIVGGLERRFCQQCSRFHGLAEFDEKKRSCRRRLSDHNARRRKPQPESVQLNPGRIYDGKQQMNVFWNRFALIHTRSDEKFLWEDTQHGSKPSEAKGFMLKPAKFEDFDGQLFPDSNNHHLPSSQHDASGFLASKTKFPSAEVLNKDIEEFAVSSNVGGPQDFHRALSLLSNSSWGAGDPKHVSPGGGHSTNPAGTTPMQAVSHPFPSATPPSHDYWRGDHQPVEPQMGIEMPSHRGGGSQFQEIQLFKSPYENYFC